MKTFTLTTLFALGTLMFFGCSQVENAVNCHAICERYQSCFNDEYDTAACEDECRTNAENDKGYAQKADICDACIDDESCASATFNCADDCIGIVP
ncbi:MAG: hypothetical protein R3B70_42290 [Polyangiaceae bacterium]